MKNLFRPLLVLTGCIVLASCVSQKQFKGLKTDYTKLQKEYQESQLQLRENQARSTSLEERLAEAQRNNSELRKSLSDMQSILNKSLTQSSQGNMNMGKLIDEINASNRFIQHLVKEKNRSDSLNLVMVNKLTRSLTREEMRDLDIKVLKGVVYISLADNMLYKSGSYEISNKAEAVLSKIAKIIQDYKDYDVLVEGNTDTDPISRTNIRMNWLPRRSEACVSACRSTIFSIRSIVTTATVIRRLSEVCAKIRPSIFPRRCSTCWPT